jgi:L-lactate dehydrogenase complex protein LldG
VSPDLAARFIDGARAAGAEVVRAAGLREALLAVAAVVRDAGVAADDVVVCRDLRLRAGAAGLDGGLPDAEPAFAAAAASMVLAQFGAAETGTVIHLDTGDDDKLAWTLPPLCVCLLDAGTIVPDLEAAGPAVAAHLERPGRPGPQVSFVTGPSRTADIECQLTIGVQGPGRFVIVLFGEGEGVAP